MATLQELKGVIKETLERRGVLSQIQARLRAEVFNALDDQTERRPPLSNENMLINELIREYLEFNHYKYTSSVFLAESGQPKTPLDREFLNNELNVRPDKQSSSIPLLYSVVSHFMEKKEVPKASASSSLRGRYRLPEDEQDYEGNGFRKEESSDTARGMHFHKSKR